MAFKKVLIHGEDEGQLDGDDRYISLEVNDFRLIVLHCEDDEGYVETELEVAEALALIRVLTEAIESLQ